MNCSTSSHPAMVMVVLVIVSVILSWIDMERRWAISRLLGDLVDPLLMPIRKILPPTGGLDFSPLVLLIGLQVLLIILHNNRAAFG